MTPEDFLTHQSNKNAFVLKLMSFFLLMGEIMHQKSSDKERVEYKQSIIFDSINQITSGNFKPPKDYNEFSILKKEQYLNSLIVNLLK